MSCSVFTLEQARACVERARCGIAAGSLPVAPRTISARGTILTTDEQTGRMLIELPGPTLLVGLYFTALSSAGVMPTEAFELQMDLDQGSTLCTSGGRNAGPWVPMSSMVMPHRAHFRIIEGAGEIGLTVRGMLAGSGSSGLGATVKLSIAAAIVPIGW